MTNTDKKNEIFASMKSGFNIEEISETIRYLNDFAGYQLIWEPTHAKTERQQDRIR